MEKSILKNKIIKVNKISITLLVIIITSIVLLFSGLILSIFDMLKWKICWDKDIIGIVCQAVTSVIFFIGSIIGISIPLQKEKYFGISYKDFNNLRSRHRFSVTSMIIFFVVLACLNLLGYFTNFIFVLFSTAIISVIFCIYISATEIPLMMRNEKRLIGIIKRKIISDFSTQTNFSNDLRAVLKYLCCYDKNINVVYDIFKDKNNNGFNKQLIFNLLEIQVEQAFDLSKIEDKEVQRKIGSALVLNVTDIINFNLDLSKIIQDDNFDQYYYYVSRVIFRLVELEEFAEEVADLIATSIWHINYFDKKDEYRKKFVLKIALSILSISVNDNNFRFVKSIRKQASLLEYQLQKNNALSIIFSLMSLKFYYLCNDNNDCPEKLKNDIKNFIEFEGIEDNTRIMSWKKLLYSQVNGFSIEFSELIDYVRLNQYNWEMWPIGISSNFVIFTTGYVLKWYLTCLFSSYKIFNYDYKNLLINDNEVKYVLSNMIDTNLSQNLSQKDYLVLPKEMINMAKFYNLDKRLSNFKRNDQIDNKFFNFINGLRIDDLNQRQKQSAAVNLFGIIDEYRKTIVGKIGRQWGFDKNIKLEGELKYISIILEKCSRASNYQEAVTEGILRAIYDEIERNTLSKELHYDSITDKDVEEMLKNHITFYSEDMKYLIGNNIHNKILQENFYEAINNARKFDSDILSGFYILLNNEDGFKFNINLDINGRNLTAEEISIEANKYKRMDGQYIYEGAFISKEKIEEYMDKQYFVLTIKFRYKVDVESNSIYKLKFN